MLLIFMLGLIHRFCLGYHYLPETGSRLSPMGHLKFWISYLVSNDVMFHRKRIQPTLAPEACHLKISLTAAYGGRNLNGYLLKKPGPSKQIKRTKGTSKNLL
ncbi:hypothetical protein TNIN_420801 [Trichonephila inaurata madagascariensis]|uniref:Uncharacterized protein n=1 Tax=Trichonephila inaurata madagascariensis TaxID=2747483 RepID=A0A8X6MBF8_9ARAC|nr:hypothetical protein TNIN_192141 [Trichonephila inaurata madagascariensis]GFY45071.1 hypothetical protein TNIN_420801 [Trichonephila inaurata madagascariensis]